MSEKRFSKINKLQEEKQRMEEISLLIAGENTSTVSQIQHEVHQVVKFLII